MRLTPVKIVYYFCYYLSYGLVKYLPTPLGEPLRFIVLKIFLKHLGWTSLRIRDGVSIHVPEKVSIGEHTTLNEFIVIDGSGRVKIGNWVRIGHRTSILSSDHSFKNRDVPIAKQELILGTITIDDDVWIGCDVKILKGVHIGKGCVIGAGAVVTKDLPPYSVAVGIPARIIKSR